MKANSISQTVIENIYKLCTFEQKKIKDVEEYLNVTHGYLNKAKRCGSTLTIDTCVSIARFFKVDLNKLCQPYKITGSDMPVSGPQYERM